MASAPQHIFSSLKGLQLSDSGADLTYLEGYGEIQAKDNSNTTIDEDIYVDADRCHLTDEYVESFDGSKALLPQSDNCDEAVDKTHYISSIIEDYFSENSWERFWSGNGERLIWASWIEKYSDYINPSYFDENKIQNESKCETNETEVDPVKSIVTKSSEHEKKMNKSSKKESKFAFDFSENNAVLKITENLEKEKELSDSVKVKESNYDLALSEGWNPLSPASVDETWSQGHHHKYRSFSENDQLLSPRCDSVTSSVPQTIGTSDSMTNVTKITSYDINSSHLPTDSSESNISIFSSAESSEESRSGSTNSSDKEHLFADAGMCTDDTCNDVDQYWQILWKKHFNEQYSIHYENYLESHPSKVGKFFNKNLPSGTSEVGEFSAKSDQALENDKSKKNAKVKNAKNRKDNKHVNRLQINSVGYLLQQLNIESKENADEPHDSANNFDSNLSNLVSPSDSPDNTSSNDKNESNKKENENTSSIKPSNVSSNPNSTLNNTPAANDNGDEPPDEKKFLNLKRRYRLYEDSICSFIYIYDFNHFYAF